MESDRVERVQALFPANLDLELLEEVIGGPTPRLHPQEVYQEENLALTMREPKEARLGGNS